jgi:putative two-component system response regulator
MEEALAKRRKELEDEVAAKMMEIEDSQQSAIIALAKLTEARDHDTGRHVERVQYLCKALTSTLREHPKYSSIIDNKYVSDMYFASALHDIGKIDIPDQVLLKPGKLTTDEFEIIKSHVKLGEKILADMVKFYPKSNLILLGRQIAKYNHEKWDGSGYLGELKGEDIPLSARIMALVDVYDALRSKRPYKEPMTHQEAYKIILEGSGKHFDPEIVEAFIQIHEQFDAIFNSLNE